MQRGKLKVISERKAPTHSYISKFSIVTIEFIAFILTGSN
jgi:hypothetical protein